VAETKVISVNDIVRLLIELEALTKYDITLEVVITSPPASKNP